MSTITPTISVPFFRNVKDCPYSESCRYAKVCMYEGEKEQGANPVCRIQDAAASAGQTMLGAALLVVGVALSLTLFLLPVGLPLALLGISLLATAGDTLERQA